MPPGSTSAPLDLPAQDSKYHNYIHAMGSQTYAYVCEYNFCFKLPTVGDKSQGSEIQFLDNMVILRNTLLLRKDRIQAFACQLNPQAIGYEAACIDEAFPKAKLILRGVFDGLKIAAALPPEMKWLRECVQHENFLCTPLLCLNMDLAHSIEIVPAEQLEEKTS